MRVYLRYGSAKTILRAASLRKKLLIKLSTSRSHSGRPVPALTLYRQVPDRVATGVPSFKSVEMICVQADKHCLEVVLVERGGGARTGLFGRNDAMLSRN